MSANGHDGNPRPDLFHDRREEGRRTVPYRLTPMAKPSIAGIKYGGKVMSGGQIGAFDPEAHGPESLPGTLQKITYS